MSSSSHHHQISTSSSASMKSTTTIVSDDDLIIISNSSEPPPPPTILDPSQQQLTQFTSLIQTEKQFLEQHNNERVDQLQQQQQQMSSTNQSSSSVELFEYDELECDNEINRITTTTTTTTNNDDDDDDDCDLLKNQKVPGSSFSPEPSGNHELAAIIKKHDEGIMTEEEHVQGVEFEEFRFEDHVTNERSSCVSKKSSKSSVVQQTTASAAVVQSSTQQTSSSSSAMETKQETIQQEQVVNGQQQQSLENGEAPTPKKTKVERKSSKAGATKKNKSNAEISKENISVSLTTDQSITGDNNKTSSSNKKSSSSLIVVPDELVKKLGPGESRVFAKVCVANLRRSFGDLTAINADNSNSQHQLRSNSLEYNNNNRVFTELKYNNSIISNKGPSSLPSRFSASSSSSINMLYRYGNNNSMSSNNKLELFQPSYWESLFCSSHDGSSISCSSSTNIAHHHHHDELLGNKKSSFSKFDSLTKKSSSNNKIAGASPESKDDGGEETTNVRPEPKKLYCASCEKQVFQMELIRAEKKDWHKNCFRCITCRKVLSVDTYQSHEQKLYCKPHFKELFQPKAVVEDDDNDGIHQENNNSVNNNKKSKLQLIICESQPKELPPDVVRASDTPSTGLEDIQIDVRSKFELFEGLKEKPTTDGMIDNNVQVKRSASVLAKLKKYENSLGGQELNGVSDEDLNGVEGIELQSDEEADESNSVIKDEIKRKLKNPLQALNEIAHFKQMEQVRSKWEEGSFTREQMSADSRKEELQKFRSRLCQGKSGQLKELYEKGLDSTDGGTATSRQAEIEELKSERARAFREMFEKGEIIRVNDDEDEEEDGCKAEKKVRNGVDLEVFEAGVARESKKIFEEMDKRVINEQSCRPQPQRSGVNKIKPSGSFVSGGGVVGISNVNEIVRSSDKPDEPIQVNTAELSNKFKFFETYEDQLERKKMEGKRETFKRFTPPREDGVVKTEKDYEDGADGQETYRDPAVVRHGEQQEDDTLHKSKTTSKMLSVFRQMEENLSKGEGTKDPIIRPLKQFTPPRETVGPGVGGGGRGSDSEEDDEDDEDVEDDNEHDVDDDDDEGEDQDNNHVMGEDEFLKEVGSLARARSLRAKFERWEQQENERNKQGGGGGVQEELAESIESAKNLKAKFEAMRLMENASSSTTTTANKENKRSPVPIRVNRFVLNNNSHTSPDLLQHSSSSSSTSPLLQFSSLPPESSCHVNHNHNNNHSSLRSSSSPTTVLIMSSGNEQCAMCEKRVYAMEKIEAGGKMYHKNCFRCSQCKSILRMDTFTSNKGTLFCTTHFKQLFKIKGNYDEGFGHETQYQVWAKKQAAAQQN